MGANIQIPAIAPTTNNENNAVADGATDVQTLINLQYVHDGTEWKRTAGTTDGKVKVEVTPAAGTQQEVIIVDPDTPTQKGKVDASGRQLVSTQPPPPPVGSDPIIEIVDDTFNNNESQNYFYTVTSGKTIELQRVKVAGIPIQDGWTIEIYKDPDGDGGSGSPVQGSWELVTLFVIPEVGGNATEDLKPDTLVGDGTARIVTRISRLGGGGNGKRGFARWVGFEI